MTKTIILEPAGCGDRCASVRTLFQEKISSGEVEVLSFDSARGRMLAEAMGITELDTPKVIMVTEAVPRPEREPETPPQ